MLFGSADRREEQTSQVRRHLCGNGVYLVTFRARDRQAQGLFLSVDFLFTKQLRDSGLLADALVGELKKGISFALRRDTIAQVTTALDAAQRAVEDELALDEAGWDR